MRIENRQRALRQSMANVMQSAVVMVNAQLRCAMLEGEAGFDAVDLKEVGV